MKTKMKASPRMKFGLGKVMAGLMLATGMLGGMATAHAQDAALPPGAVFTAIHNIKVQDDKADWVELDNGVVSTFWYGHEFDVGGRHFYTGFVWNTPERDPQEDEGFPAPDAQVKLAQATFLLTNPGQTPAYTFYSVERKPARSAHSNGRRTRMPRARRSSITCRIIACCWPCRPQPSRMAPPSRATPCSCSR
jgi:hypothetical protein